MHQLDAQGNWRNGTKLTLLWIWLIKGVRGEGREDPQEFDERWPEDVSSSPEPPPKRLWENNPDSMLVDVRRDEGLVCEVTRRMVEGDDWEGEGVWGWVGSLGKRIWVVLVKDGGIELGWLAKGRESLVIRGDDTEALAWCEKGRLRGRGLDRKGEEGGS
jgi:hypothetical protein